LNARDILPESEFGFKYDKEKSLWFFVSPTGELAEIEQMNIVANGDKQVCIFQSNNGRQLGQVSKVPKEKIVSKFKGDLIVFDFKTPLDNSVQSFALEILEPLDDGSRKFLTELLRTGPCQIQRSIPFQSLFLEHLVILTL
jgi:hypothetical protein